MAQWTFVITLIFILGSVLVSLFISGRSKDRCLKDFHEQPVVLKLSGEQELEGNLLVESSGMELIFNKDYAAKHNKKSYLLYKEEYPKIIRVLRRYNLLNTVQRRTRDAYIKTGYYHRLRRSTLRKFRNLFNTFRDSFIDALNLFIGQATRGRAVPQVLSGQDRYIGKMKEEVVGSLGRAYDPLLERCIGHRVTVVEKSGDESNAYAGVLKEYTPNFLEILNTDVETSGKADMIFPRATATVRYVVE